MLRFFADQPRLRTGLWSSSQGGYRRQQVLLDVSQGARQPGGLYADVDEDGDGELDDLRFDPRTRSFADWAAVPRAGARRRVGDAAPWSARRLGAGRRGFATARGAPPQTAIAAADERGRVAAVSRGAGHARRAGAAAGAHAAGRRRVGAARPRRTAPAVAARARPHARRAAADRAASRHARPARLRRAARSLRAPAGVRDRRRAQRRPDVRLDAPRRARRVDRLPPTVLEWIGVRPPDRMRGQPIESGAQLSVARLDELRERWSRVRDGRQAASLTAIVTSR